MRHALPALATLLLVAAPAGATTWDEPWHDRVVREAQAFVRAKVLENEEQERATLERLEQLAGDPVPDRFVVDGFYLLDIRSTSGGGAPVRLKEGLTYYLLLRRRGEGDAATWALATPTAGHAEVMEGGLVSATFRHSYHQAAVPEGLYARTTTAIFRHHHGEPLEAPELTPDLLELLEAAPDAPPADPTDPDNLFFRQHAALETLFHLDGAGVAPERLLALLEPFLGSDQYHVQISAVRALGVVDTAAARERLLAFLRAPDPHGFAKVMAVWALRAQGAREHLEALAAYAEEAETEEVGFGGNIMDPRIATAFPESVKAAVEALVAEWRDEGEGR